MKGVNTEYETIQDDRAVFGCQLVNCPIATFGGIFPCAGHWKRRWGRGGPMNMCVKTTYCDFLGDFESVRERGGKYKQVRKSRDPSTEQPGGRNELSRLKL